MNSSDLLRRAVAAALALAVLLPGFGSSGSAHAQAHAIAIVADGSSTVYPITRDAARRYVRQARGTSIDVKFSGTSAGFRKFCDGQLDIGNASRRINAQEQAQCAAKGVRFIELPVAWDAMAVVTHFDNTWAKDITTAELRKIWSPDAEGKVMKWSDVRAGWPDRRLALYGRGQDSGTYDHFTESIVGTTRASRKDYFGSEDEELLAQKIGGDPDALGFFGIGAYHRHYDTLQVLAIDAGAGAVHPSLHSVRDQTYTPLSRPLFIYVNVGSLSAKPALGPFVEHYLDTLPRWIHFTGYLPLDDALHARTLKRYAARREGTYSGDDLRSAPP